MEKLIVNQQRKKRRTRKSLDAIRKKALQTVRDIGFNKNIDTEINYKNNKYFVHKTSICMTSNRLTLFSKAVRSDPVLRSHKSNDKIERKPCGKGYKNDHINIVKKLAIYKSPIKEVTANVVSINFDNPSVDSVSYDKGTGTFNGYKTERSITFFSPLSQADNSDISDKLQISRHQPDIALLSSSFSMNNSYCENNFYNEVMNEIPNYLQETASTFLKNDIMHKCKTYLRNIFNENNHMETEYTSILKNSQLCSSFNYQSIIKNPTEYIGYSYQEILRSKLVTSSNGDIASDSTIGQSSSPLSLTVSDSPEYVYYPHKLNQ